jgi:hypothetical protein
MKSVFATKHHFGSKMLVFFKFSERHCKTGSDLTCLGLLHGATIGIFVTFKYQTSSKNFVHCRLWHSLLSGSLSSSCSWTANKRRPNFIQLTFSDWPFTEALPFTNTTIFFEQIIPLVDLHLRYFPAKRRTKSPLCCNYGFRFVTSGHMLSSLHWRRHSPHLRQ